MRLGEKGTLEAGLRHVDDLADGSVPAYTELNTRLAWAVTDYAEMAIVGRNLLHDDHLEYTGGQRIPRSVYAELQWRF